MTGIQNVGHMKKGKYDLNFCNLSVWSDLVTIDDNDQEIREAIQTLLNKLLQTRGVAEMFRSVLFQNHMDTSLMYIP